MSARGAMTCVLATGLANAMRADDAHPDDMAAGVFGDAVSAFIRKTVDEVLEISERHDRCANSYCRSSEVWLGIERTDKNRIRELEAAIAEITAGFTPDGTYAGRPIYEITAGSQ